jgi:hypothetical protein
MELQMSTYKPVVLIWASAYTRAYLPFDDPAGFHGSAQATLEEFRRVRDLIGQAMRTWQPQAASARLQHQE